MDLVLADLGVVKNLLNWLDGVSEVLSTELFELGSGKCQREIFSSLKSVNLNAGLHGCGQHSLGFLALGSESSKSLLVSSDIDSLAGLELLNAILDNFVIEILSS